MYVRVVFIVIVIVMVMATRVRAKTGVLRGKGRKKEKRKKKKEKRNILELFAGQGSQRSIYYLEHTGIFRSTSSGRNINHVALHPIGCIACRVSRHHYAPGTCMYVGMSELLVYIPSTYSTLLCTMYRYTWSR